MPCSSRSGAPAIVLDLDDTLYLERDYVRSGLTAAGKWLDRQRGIAGLGDAAITLFEGGLRERLFDRALAQMGVEPSPSLIARLVFEYRRHRPSIALAPDAVRFLSDATMPLAVVTDGSALAQRMKVCALGLRAFGIESVIYTDDWGRSFWKPHRRAFEQVQRSIAADHFIYVADNPAKDFRAPRALGWRTVQICRPERLHRVEAPDRDHQPDVQIGSFDELATLFSPATHDELTVGAG